MKYIPVTANEIAQTLSNLYGVNVVLERPGVPNSYIFRVNGKLMVGTEHAEKCCQQIVANKG